MRTMNHTDSVGNLFFQARVQAPGGDEVCRIDRPQSDLNQNFFWTRLSDANVLNLCCTSEVLHAAAPLQVLGVIAYIGEAPSQDSALNNGTFSSTVTLMTKIRAQLRCEDPPRCS